MILAPSADKKIRNYDIEWYTHDPSLLTLRPKGLRHSKMKWWAVHTNLPVDVIFTLPHPRNRDSQNHETSLAPSADKPTRNYHIEYSNQHPFLSTLRPNGFSRSEMKWWAIYTNLSMDDIVRLSHPQSRDSQNQEMFLPPSTDKQTRNYDIEC